MPLPGDWPTATSGVTSGATSVIGRFNGKKRLANPALIATGIVVAVFVIGIAIWDVQIVADQYRQQNRRDMDAGAMAASFVWHAFRTSFALAFYFTPSVIGFFRKHQNAPAILALNFFLGITGIGWIAALVWSVTEVGSREHRHIHYYEAPR